MEYKYFIEFGAKVRRTWKDYCYYRLNAAKTGYHYDIREEIVEICGTPRDIDTKRFVSLEGYVFDDEIEILVRDEKGEKYYATLEELSVYATMEDLSFEDLKSLREQISLGSCYLADYENSFGVDRNEVCSYADGFGEEIGWNDDLDTPENFALYCQGDLIIDAA